MTRGTRTRFLTAALASTLVLATGSEARASLIGLDVTVTFVEQGTVTTDVVTVGPGPGAEITEGDATNIGGGILLEGEFIDIGDSNIVYRVRGDGDEHPSDPDYQLTGFDPDAYFVFDFQFLSPGDHIVGVTVGLEDVIGVAWPGQVEITPDSVTLFVGTLGVLGVVGAPDLGRITLNLTIESTGPPGPGSPVPEPSSWAALGLGLLALAWRRRRRG